MVCKRFLISLILAWGDIVKKLLLALSLVLLLTPAAIASENPLDALTIGGVDFNTQGEYVGPYYGERMVIEYVPEDLFLLQMSDGAWILANPNNSAVSHWINRMSSWVETGAKIYVNFGDNNKINGIKIEPPSR